MKKVNIKHPIIVKPIFMTGCSSCRRRCSAEWRKNQVKLFVKILPIWINNDETTSMRNLSTSIGASDSFIQKILTEKANPSLEKIDLISEYFDVESWEMLYNFRKDNNDMLSILQMLQKLPASSMPVVKEFLAFLLRQFTDSSSH